MYQVMNFSGTVKCRLTNDVAPEINKIIKEAAGIFRRPLLLFYLVPIRSANKFLLI